MKKIVAMGRGGSGKTSFVALMTKYFIENGDTPLLLVDVDPDQNLAEMVGIDLEDEEKQTISDLLIETFLENGGTTVGVPPSERIENRIWEKGVYEGTDFDLVAVGTKFLEGCYCLPDAALKTALEVMTKTYKYVLIDSPAGLEHLNRRITSSVDDIFAILDPAKKAFQHLERAYKIMSEIKIKFNNLYVLANFRFSHELLDLINKRPEFKYLGKLEHDPKVEKFNLQGESLLEIQEDSLMFESIKRIAASAGY